MQDSNDELEEQLQEFFKNDFSDLRDSDENEIEYIEQSHFGDLLIETYNTGDERYKLWRNLDSNGGEIEIEYCGHRNKYTWETIYKQ